MCKGTCGHISDTPGMCGTDGCANQGQSFEKCECGDDMHGKDHDWSPQESVPPPASE